VSVTETVNGISGKGNQPVGTKEDASYGEHVRLVNVRVQASKEVCEHLGALLQKNTGLMQTGFTPEKTDATIFRLYLTCPESKCWPRGAFV